MVKDTTVGIAGLRPCKRYITTHDKDGKSIYGALPAQHYHHLDGMGDMARSYAIASVPAKLADDADMKAYLSTQGPTSYKRRKLVLPVPGANLTVVDLEPGGESQWHRTTSLDYSICVIGKVEHELDGGGVVTLLPGDHIIQRGTMHRWKNTSQTEPARFVACGIPCEPFEVGGKSLKDEFEANPRSKL